MHTNTPSMCMLHFSNAPSASRQLLQRPTRFQEGRWLFWYVAVSRPHTPCQDCEASGCGALLSSGGAGNHGHTAAASSAGRCNCTLLQTAMQQQRRGTSVRHLFISGVVLLAGVHCTVTRADATRHRCGLLLMLIKHVLGAPGACLNMLLAAA
jgi:hypothetical protein